MHFSWNLLRIFQINAFLVFGYSSLIASGEFKDLSMTFANNLNQDEALQNIEPHLISNLFDTQIIYRQDIEWKQ